MTLSDNTAFRQRLVALGEVFDVKLSPQRQVLYFEALRDLPFEAVVRGLNAAVRGCSWFPKPAELRSLAVGDVADAVEAAWMATKHAMRAAGAYASLVIADAALGETILTVFGSWPQACALDLSPEMWANKRKEFERVYRVLRNRGVMGGRYLAGLSEQQNAGRRQWMGYVPVYRLEAERVTALTLAEAETARLQLATAHHQPAQLTAGPEAP